MAAVSITVSDLEPFAEIGYLKAEAMITDALATAALDAPCILSEDFEHPEVALAIIRGAILRWNDSGSGALQQQTAGPFNQTIDTRVRRDDMFTDGEIARLKRLCTGEASGAFDIDTVPTGILAHADSCSIFFGSDCSCGAVLTQGLPLWGGW